MYIFNLNDSLRHIFYHMTIDLKTVKHISKLARISVDEEKANKLANDLNSIFEFIEKLNELKTDNVEPLTSIADVKFSVINTFNFFDFSDLSMNAFVTSSEESFLLLILLIISESV